eukprot:6003273-Alexandrium_andersonii.AAC.1
MSASLVGSEMCIRDRPASVVHFESGLRAADFRPANSPAKCLTGRATAHSPVGHRTGWRAARGWMDGWHT